MSQKTTNGMWVKYDCEPGNWHNDDASYNKLYNDLKDSNVEWSIAKNKYECMRQLCGEYICCDGTVAGDIYVYYVNDNGVKNPILYIHVSEFDDTWTKEKKNHIYFNECSLGYDGIDNEYLPELIGKLREIDKNKNKYFIEKLETRYKNYQRVLFLNKQETYTEEELLFLYFMAYEESDSLAISIIEKRDIQKDFDDFTDENKVKLYLSVKDSSISDKLIITSRKILIDIAKNKCLKQLNNTTEEIINDKKYIISLLEYFYESDKNSLNYFELERHLPEKYKTDIDVLEHFFYNYTTLISLMASGWISHSQNSKELSANPEFAYRLINSFTKALINNGEQYYANSLLWVFEDSILNDIENHILIGPEPTKEREELKDRSIKELKLDKEKVLRYRRNNKK